MSSSYRNSLNNWLSTLEVNADRVLDIGGSQEKMPPRVKSWDVKEYLIADLPEPHKDSPKPDIELDLNQSILHELLLDEYDLIFCLEVFDYIYDPMNAFNIIAAYLKSGGVAWISFPSIYPLHQPVEDDSLRYMTGGIKKLAAAAGLEIIQMIPRRPETDLLLQFYSVERLRAAKHEDHNVLGWIVEMRKS